MTQFKRPHHTSLSGCVMIDIIVPWSLWRGNLLTPALLFLKEYSGCRGWLL